MNYEAAKGANRARVMGDFILPTWTTEPRTERYCAGTRHGRPCGTRLRRDNLGSYCWQCDTKRTTIADEEAAAITTEAPRLPWNWHAIQASADARRNPGSKWSRECACGNPKASGAAMCHQCRYPHLYA